MSGLSILSTPIKGRRFFHRSFTKKGEIETEKKKKGKTRKGKSKFSVGGLRPFDSDLPALIDTIPDNLKIYINEFQELIALPKAGKEISDLFFQKLKTRPTNLTLGKFKGKDFIPSHFLAMSGLYSKELATVNVDSKTALEYLAKEQILIPESKKGWVLIKHNGLALGWVKNLGNRINNYYPKGYQLRKIIT